jgi:acyl dehydratase
MTANIFTRRGLYFEEFEDGQLFITAARTITEADIVSFAGLSGDYTTLHTDAEYSKTTPFGERVAHGLLILAIASGLAARLGILEGTVIAFREVENWKFIKPVKIGDTVHAEMTVASTKALPRIGGGAVSMAMEIKNQDEDVVMKGTWNMLMTSKP